MKHLRVVLLALVLAGGVSGDRTAAQETFSDTSSDAHANNDIQDVTIWHDAANLYIEFGSLYINDGGFFYIDENAYTSFFVNGNEIVMYDADPSYFSRDITLSGIGQLVNPTTLRIPRMLLGSTSVYTVTIASHFVRERFITFPEDKRRRLLAQVEQWMSCGEADIENAVATCFLENVSGEQVSADIRRYLGRDSREYSDRWNS